MQTFDKLPYEIQTRVLTYARRSSVWKRAEIVVTRMLLHRHLSMQSPKSIVGEYTVGRLKIEYDYDRVAIEIASTDGVIWSTEYWYCDHGDYSRNPQWLCRSTSTGGTVRVDNGTSLFKPHKIVCKPNQ
jgi:hypothetical protein